MEFVINRIGKTDDFVLYDSDKFPEISGISSLYNKWILLSPFYSLRKIMAFNRKKAVIYELKQTNLLLKLLYSTVFALINDPIMCPAYKLFISGVCCGKLYKPQYVKEQVEYKLRYKERTYDISFHNPNIIAVLYDGIQVIKMEILNSKCGGKYHVIYDDKAIKDVMLIFLTAICMDNAIFPLDYYRKGVFGYKKEMYPERVKWLPK